MKINEESRYVLLKTVFEGDNFGSSLQAFALKSFIENDLNTKCIVVVRCEKGIRAKILKLKSRAVSFVKCFLNLRLFVNIWSGHFNKNKADKYSEDIRKQFKAFTDNCIMPDYLSKKELKSLARRDNCIKCITGSDQVWNPTLAGVNPVNFLRFSPKSKNISYAASIGASEIPYYNYFAFKRNIKNINHISVREQDAKQLLYDNFGIEARVCLDPTLLAGKDFWIAKKENIQADKPYTFCYFLNKPSKQAVNMIKNKIAKNERVLVVSKKDFAEYVSGIQTINDVSPLQFVSYVCESECVLTDSFHGMVFSIMHNKPFYVFERDYENYIPQPSRIVTLLKELEISERYIFGDESSTEIGSIDYSKVNRVIEEKRKRSVEFLKELIGNE